MGWSGIIIALIIENVIGLNLNAPRNQVTWNIQRKDSFGIRNLRFNNHRCSFICQKRAELTDAVNMTIESEKPFSLLVETKRGKYTLEVRAGVQSFLLE